MYQVATRTDTCDEKDGLPKRFLESARKEGDPVRGRRVRMQYVEEE